MLGVKGLIFWSNWNPNILREQEILWRHITNITCGMKQQMWKSVKVFCEIYSRCTFSNPCPTWLASILCCVQQVFKPGHKVMRHCVPWVGELPKRAACEASGSSINMTLIWSFIRFPPPSLPQLSSFPSLQGRPVPQAQQSVWMNVTSLWHSGGIDQLWSCKDLHDFRFRTSFRGWSSYCKQM